MYKRHTSTKYTKGKMHTNRLAREKSPYLLQHQHNPVDWYPWGEEAFARARAEDKPIFLSIGYSTCHWCHVMERESFESEAVAARMNEGFINIKVDREERPDVDQIYMAFVQATTGGGGWPMSVFLTPELKPFFGGTYFPPEDRHGRRGFGSLLEFISKTWRERRADLAKSGDSVVRALQQQAADAPRPELLDRASLRAGFEVFRKSFDRKHSGFGGAPKFPRPSVLRFLLRWYARAPVDADAGHMVVATLGDMARGGIHDHLGGGFHRYSVDAEWHVPHFEKMLYDEAQLAVAYLECSRIFSEPGVVEVARGIFRYVLRDLCDAQTGAFFSAEDADSLAADGTKKEGAFYVFTRRAIEELLGEPAANIFCRYYAIEDDGNADDPHGELTGQNVLHRVGSLEATAKEAGKSLDEMDKLLADSRDKLLALRNTRPRPHLDDKVLVAWNGLMISALAVGARMLADQELLAAAVRAATFITERLWKEGVLYRRYRDGDVAIPGYLDDYAMLAAGLIDLYEASFDLRWLLLAEQLSDKMIALFSDAEGGGFFTTSGADPSVLVRMKDDYDGAEPAGNSVAAVVLARLGAILDRGDFLRLANSAVRLVSSRIKETPHALPEMMVAFDLLLDGPTQIVIAGEKDAPDTRALLDALRAGYTPRAVLLLADAATRATLGPRLRHLKEMVSVEGKATAYVCQGWACERPTTNPADLLKLAAPRLDK